MLKLLMKLCLPVLALLALTSKPVIAGGPCQFCLYDYFCAEGGGPGWWCVDIIEGSHVYCQNISYSGPCENTLLGKECENEAQAKVVVAMGGLYFGAPGAIGSFYLDVARGRVTRVEMERVASLFPALTLEPVAAE